MTMPQNRKILVFENSQSICDFLIRKWQKMGEDAVYKRNRFNVALSGGRTPGEFYTKLSSLDILDLWQKTHIFWADERFVPSTSNRSNYRMVKETLLNYVPIPGIHIHPIPTDVDNASVAAEQYKDLLVAFFSFKKNTLPCFDLILLGIGDDGHTASLYPELTAIDDPRRLTIPVGLNYLQEDRVSLSLSVINNASHTILLATGRKKADVMKAIIDEGKILPVSRVSATEGETLFILDRDAASKLKDPSTYFYRDQSQENDK